MAKTRITKKCSSGAEILEAEWISDLEPGHLVALVRRGKITPNQIYSACQHYGYRWQNGRWKLVAPRWLETVMKNERTRIIRSWRDG